MASVSVLNSIGTVVHNAPDKAVSVLSSFGTVVHDTPATLDAVSVLSSFGTVVHDTPPALQAVSVQGMFGTTVHDSNFIFNVSDIVGTVGSPATFDASTQGFSTSSYAHEWSWISVPGGSSYANQSIPFPNGGVNTYFDMTDNVGLWHLNGTADDESGLANNGSVVGSPSTVAGRVGQALLFNGSTDYVDVPNNASLNSNIGTVALWIKFSSVTTPMSLISKNDAGASRNGWHLYIDNNEISAQIKDGVSTTTLDSSTSINDGQWHHVMLVFESGGTSILYLDGQEQDRNNSTVTFTVSTQNLRIAKNVDAFWNEFDGTIDEVALWSRKLDVNEIYDLYYLQASAVAAGDAPDLNLDDQFTFTPDVAGTYTINVNFYNYSSKASANGNVDAVISSGGGGSIITGSTPTVDLVEANSTGYVINTYAINLLSVQRSRESEQVPFKIGTKGRQSLRLSTNTEFTGSS